MHKGVLFDLNESFIFEENFTNIDEKEIVFNEGSQCKGEVFDKPFVGQCFLSEEEAFVFYQNFAKSNGFSIRKGRFVNKNGEKKRRDFFCHRQGKQRAKIVDHVKRQRNRSSIRCDCKAHMRITLKRSNDFFPEEWKITRFIIEHNHDLLSTEELQGSAAEEAGGMASWSTGLCRSSDNRKRAFENTEECATPSPKYTTYSFNKNKYMKIDHRDPVALKNRVLGLDSPKYGSVTKDIDEIFSKRKKILNPFLINFPSLGADSVDLESGKNSFNLNGHERHHANKIPDLVINIDSDDDEPIYQKLSIEKHKSVGDDDVAIENNKSIEDDADVASEITKSLKLDGVAIENNKSIEDDADVASEITKSLKDDGVAVENNNSIEDDAADVASETAKSLKDDSVASDNAKSVEDDVAGEKNHNKGLYLGSDDEDDTESDQSDVNFDGLGDIWKEFNVGLESTKDADPSNKQENEDEKECDHSFIMKEDIGSVCRVCGIIERSIESIIEYQRPKGSKSIRTYHRESELNTGDLVTHILDGMKLPKTDFSVCELSAHPRHKKQMKPHQIEGFNFLLSNLVTENPGGCILAHAPGSGKTFMLISFIQSFMAKYPDAKPLVILPRGILGTWKKEFLKWQVENLPLFDFYSVKADSRPQQLEVLNQWANERSILFLGYQQFASIVCDNNTHSVTISCQEILLKCPSILILDEGHTPRNPQTNILTALEKVKTPRKVVLSGTLYQNHVHEVFNILNLVRPKFLKMENPKLIKRRILSRVSRKRLIKNNADNEFYDVVEHTLLKDDNFKRKVTVIEDLREMTSKVLHYYKGDFLDELPGLVDFSVFLKLTPKQKHELSELKKFGPAYKFKLNSDGSAIYVHPGLKSLLTKIATKDKNDTNHNISKIETLIETLDENEGVKAKFFLNMIRLCESTGEKLLVFSQYLLPLKFLVSLTAKTKKWSVGKEIFMITGDHDNDERESAMEQFNNCSESRVFFGSIKACGEGISLVGASRIIILDVHLNPSVTRQAIGRAFRPGQTRKVYTYRLIASESPEEDDHNTCFKKESVSKMWFEWDQFCGHHDFEIEKVNVEDCGDEFLESSCLNEDVTAIYKR